MLRLTLKSDFFYEEEEKKKKSSKLINQSQTVRELYNIF